MISTFCKAKVNFIEMRIIMKYVVILGDGMADEPLEELNGKTPLEAASTPTIDLLAGQSQIGLTRTVPTGMSPGSDTANLSVMGYNPRKYYTGRSPLEALSIGVPMKDTDIAIRCNIVTVTDDELPYEEKTIIDHSSGEISTQEAALLIQAVQEKFGNDEFSFYVGTSYRHLLIWNQGQVVDLTAPHDVLGQKIGEHLPQEAKLREMMKESYELLNAHPVNVKRKELGLNPANSLWFWGAGTRPQLSSFEEKNHLKGAMISAVDLLKGIAVGAGMHNIIVEGANGTLETNYEGKAQAAVDALTKEGFDFVYVHVEAPDEMGHQGSLERKLKSIEYLDSRVIAPVKKGLEASGEEFRMLIMPDHPTPIHVRTHTSDPVPYLLYDSTKNIVKDWHYNEREAADGVFVENGYEILDVLFAE